MAFGIKREELNNWKKAAKNEEIAFITHFWYDPRFPGCTTVTKVACANMAKLIRWGERYGLKKEWIHKRNDFPHFDLLGERQKEILKMENKFEQLQRLEEKKKG
ncbi:hypothetical protein [Evansella cellulosilytica]|uniref:Uncharacterized protein n=1 Tax=Evansella cellulosilytica (strain ATCC 21833 / DSM 2522 / FERM P-1141 / JCM 9156 / N-4) TaxID=649639 RepID=E6U239_EVAC2|nr:hypothetical protein [Evansella cellulosilytica]ADU30417.1 hypothetical protein Bcell_2156 [Evansella cellulosilytica DSM 2522]